MHTSEAVPDLYAEWLRGEEVYRLRRYGQPNPHRLRFITQVEVPRRWSSYAVSNQYHDSAQATQRIMKACAAAREGVIIANMQRGASYEDAGNATLINLREAYPAVLADQSAWRSRLNMGFESAVGRYNTETLHPVYMTIASLAITHVMADAEDRGQLWLPEPGRPSGIIVSWAATNPPQQ